MPADAHVQDRHLVEFDQLQEVIFKHTRQLLKFYFISAYMT